MRQFAGSPDLVILVPGERQLNAFMVTIHPVYDGTPMPKPTSLRWSTDGLLVIEHTVTIPADKAYKLEEPLDLDGVVFYRGVDQQWGVKREDAWGYVVDAVGSGGGRPLLARYDDKGVYLSEYEGPDEKKARRLDHSGRPKKDQQHSVVWIPGPDGVVRTRVVRTGLPDPTMSIEVIDPAVTTGWRRVYRESGEELSFSPLGFEANDGRLMGLVQAPGRVRGVAALDLATGEVGPTLVTVPGYDINGAVTDIYSSRIVGYGYADERYRVRWIDPRLEALEAAAAKLFEGSIMSLDSWSTDLNSALVYVEGPGDPGSWWVVRPASSEKIKVGDAYPAVPAEYVAEMRPYSYKARDGKTISGYLTLPPGRPATGLPLIIMPHGGPSARDVMGFDWWAQSLAARGYAVLQPNFRGSDGFGRDFEEAGHGQWGAAMQDDLSDGVLALTRSGIADPARVCIVGASYGGYAALAGATLTPELYRCVVAVAGVGDLPAMIAHSKLSKKQDSLATRYWSRIIGDPVADAERLRAASPRYQADRVTAPILLIHGRDDTIVPISQSQDMLKALQAAGKTVVFVQLDGEDHHLRYGGTRTQMLEALFAFLAQHNPAD